MQIYTVEEVAKILHVRKGFVYDLVYTGKLRAFRLSERRFRITEKALNDFMLSGEKENAEKCSSYNDSNLNSGGKGVSNVEYLQCLLLRKGGI